MSKLINNKLKEKERYTEATRTSIETRGDTPILVSRSPVPDRCWKWGELYNGETSTTVTGKTCQYWDITFPNLPNFAPNGTRRNSNYCMNDNNI